MGRCSGKLESCGAGDLVLEVCPQACAALSSEEIGCLEQRRCEELESLRPVQDRNRMPVSLLDQAVVVILAMRPTAREIAWSPARMSVDFRPLSGHDVLRVVRAVHAHRYPPR